jgi:hypothetical protein
LYPSGFIEVISDGTKIAQFQGATADADGQAGFIPAPVAGQQGSLLVGDGSWSAGLSFLSGNLTLDGEYISTLGSGVSQFRAVGGNYGLMVLNDGTSSRLLLTDSGDQFGSWNSLRPFSIDNATGTVNIGNNALTVTHGGNVGVGVFGASSPLHVVSNNTATGSSAGVTIEQGGTGDAILQFLLPAVQRWSMGIDNSDSDKLKIGRGADWSGGVDITIDTSGNVSIGTSDTTGALLILDTKTSSGDPTGVAGGMYFNSNTGRFRCNDGSSSTSWYNCDGGALGYAQTTSSQGPFASITDLTGLSVTVTVPANHRIRITGSVSMTSNTVGDAPSLLIREGSTQLMDCNIHTVVASQSDNIHCSVVLTPSAGSHTYKLSGQRVAGTGNVSTVQSSSRPAYILVEDLGRF